MIINFRFVCIQLEQGTWHFLTKLLYNFWTKTLYNIVLFSTILTGVKIMWKLLYHIYWLWQKSHVRNFHIKKTGGWIWLFLIQIWPACWSTCLSSTLYSSFVFNQMVIFFFPPMDFLIDAVLKGTYWNATKLFGVYNGLQYHW